MATTTIPVSCSVVAGKTATLGIATSMPGELPASVTATVLSETVAQIFATAVSDMRQVKVIGCYVELAVLSSIYSEYITETRERMMDFPDENILIEGQQVNDTAIMKALDRALRDYNSTPPLPTKYTIENHPYIDTIILKTLAIIFDTLALAEFRNQLNYGTSGIQLGIRDKGTIYKSVAESYNQEYKNRRALEKQQLNVEACYGNAPF